MPVYVALHSQINTKQNRHNHNVKTQRGQELLPVNNKQPIVKS